MASILYAHREVFIKGDYYFLKPTIKNYLGLEPLSQEQLKKRLAIGYVSYTDKPRDDDPCCALLLNNLALKQIKGIRNVVEFSTQFLQQFVEQKLTAPTEISPKVRDFLISYWMRDAQLYKNVSKQFDHSWLVHINLRNNQLQRFNLKKIIEAYPRLRSLDLSHNSIKTLKSKMFNGMPKIFYLNLSHNPVTAIDDAAIDALLQVSRSAGFLKSGAFIIYLRGIYLHTQASDVYDSLYAVRKRPFTGQQLCCTGVAQAGAIMFFILMLYSVIAQPCDQQTDCKALMSIFSLLTAGLEAYTLYRPCDNYHNRLSSSQHILLD